MSASFCCAIPHLDSNNYKFANGLFGLTIIFLMLLFSELLRRPIEVKPQETQMKAVSTAMYNVQAVREEDEGGIVEEDEGGAIGFFGKEGRSISLHKKPNDINGKPFSLFYW